MIKKFSSPKIKIWFEPMFFYGFFYCFERCGSAAFPNFRGGIFSPKCVRTNLRILHKIIRYSLLFWLFCVIFLVWAISSVGRATALHAEGRRFESCIAHFYEYG